MRSRWRIGELVLILAALGLPAGCGGHASSSASSPKATTVLHLPAAAHARAVPACKRGELSTKANPCTKAAPAFVPGQTSETAAALKKAEIVRVWKTFFNGATPISQRVALLADGQRFAATIKTLSQDPLASKTLATVSNVTVTGPTTATVTFTVLLSGVPLLKDVHGTDVLQDGAWLVDPASLCRLLALDGTLPPACPTTGSKA